MQDLEVMVTLFAIVILGYVLRRLGYMGGDFDRRLSSIVITVTCPALVLSSVMGRELPDARLIVPLVGVGFATYVILSAVAFTVPRLVSKDPLEQGMVGFAMMFGNVGFIGYPVVASIFGAKAVFYAALLNIPNTFFIFTVGSMLVRGERSRSSLRWQMLVSPMMLSSYVAIAIVALGVHVPQVVANPVSTVGAVTVPASLMVIGSSLAGIGLGSTLRDGKVYVTALFRLFVVPVSLYALFRAVGVDELVNEVNAVVIAMPVAAFGVMFCMKYQRDARIMTEATFVTTVLSVVTIPLIHIFIKALQ